MQIYIYTQDGHTIKLLHLHVEVVQATHTLLCGLTICHPVANLP